MTVRILAAALLVSMIGNAGAADSYTVASDLGDILASETACELTYRREAIEAFVTENVDASDMEFTRNLSLVTGVRKREIDEMPASEKTAHCSQVHRAAKHFGFID